MNIKTVPGNIVDTPEGINVIIHQANIDKRMGAGVALALCDKWPEIRNTDREWTKEDKNTLGDFSIIQVESGPKFVFNLYGQSILFDSLAGCRTDYNAVIAGFAKIRNLLESWRNKWGFEAVIGIPRLMGCGLAGGNWEIYYKIIEETFKNTDFTIVIVDFGK